MDFIVKEADENVDKSKTSLTIKEYQKARNQLERDIMLLIQSFENKFDCNIRNIELGQYFIIGSKTPRTNDIDIEVIL